MRKIEVTNATKRYRTKSGFKIILLEASFEVSEGEKVAVIGRNGAGKSTLLKLLGGVEYLDKGDIRTDLTISWPIGFSGGFQGTLTGRDNIVFLARIYGLNENTIVRRVNEFAELGEYIDMPVKTYSSGMRARLAFGVSLLIDFDCYLIDEIISVGDSYFQAKSRDMFHNIYSKKTLIIVSHDKEIIREYCNSAIVLQEGRVVYYSDMEEAIHRYMDV